MQVQVSVPQFQNAGSLQEMHRQSSQKKLVEKKRKEVEKQLESAKKEIDPDYINQFLASRLRNLEL